MRGVPHLLVLAAAAAAASACDSRADAPAGGAEAGERGGRDARPRQAPPSGRPAAAPPKAQVPLPVFVDVAEEAGVAVVNHTGKPLQKDWLVSAMGGGSIAFDYDSDGDMDLLVVDGTMLTAEAKLVLEDDARTRLFRNDGGLRFTEVTREAGIDIQAFGFGGAACDYDADGHPDVYVCCWGRNFLLRNRGDGTFEEVAAKTGVLGEERDMSTACAWGDVDGDGVHDLYVANYGDQWALIEEFARDGKPGRSAKFREMSVYVGPEPIPPQPDRLYLGNGDGTFREVTATHLRDQHPYYGFQPVMSDFDNDGDLDVFVANDTQANHLWVNDGKGVFRDAAVTAGVATNQNFLAQAGMGVDVEDLDRDGWFDITVTNFSDDYNTVYLNRTGRTRVLAFQDVSSGVKIVGPSYKRLSWGVRFLDYDNDGWLDHLVTCGHVYGEIDGFERSTQTSYRQACQLLRCDGPTAFAFTEVTEKSGPAFAIRRVWRGAAFADFDDDGDTDFFVAALNDKAALFRNDGGNANAFLRIRLVGSGTQRDPAGARVALRMPPEPGKAEGRVHLSELHHGASFCSDNDPRFLFGCGSLETVPEVEVRWRRGPPQVFRDVPTRRAYVITQGVDELVPEPLGER